MSEHHTKSSEDTRRATASDLTRSVDKPVKVKQRSSKSMHDGIAVWCDCCSCEAEPYWLELADELGIDLGSDYEDVDD